MNDTENLSLLNAAVLIRSAIKDIQGIATGGCVDKNDITEEKAKEMIPDTLFRFVASLLGGSLAHDIVECSTDMDKEVEKRVISLCQDIIYTVKRSRVKTPKHVGLSVSIKN